MKVIDAKHWATHTFSLCSSGMNSPFYVIRMNGAGQTTKMPCKTIEEGYALLEKLYDKRVEQFPNG